VLEGDEATRRRGVEARASAAQRHAARAECATQAERGIARMEGGAEDLHPPDCARPHCAPPPRCVSCLALLTLDLPGAPAHMLTSAELRKRLDQTGSQLDGLRGYL
jgi:hypothetical protein